MDEEDQNASDLRVGTETWELYKDLIDLWVVYTTNCRGSETDGLQFVLRQAGLLRELSDYPSDIVNRAARDLGRMHKHFGVIQWVRKVRGDVARLVRWSGEDSALPTTALLRFWKNAPPPFWRAARRLPKVPERTREAFAEITALAEFINATYHNERDGLISAADRVVAGYLVWAVGLLDLPEKLKRASADVEMRLRFGALGRATLERLDQIRVLLPDQSPHGRSTLARRFREIERPELAVAITRDFDASIPSHQYAVIARAAAHLDLKNVSAAEQDANEVWIRQNSHAAAVVLSRAARVRHQDNQNLVWALAAWDLARNPHTAQNLVTASLLRSPTGREKDVEDAHEVLRERSDVQHIHRRNQYVIIRSARLLFQEGRVDVAERVAAEILVHDSEYFPAKQLLVDIRLAK